MKYWNKDKKTRDKHWYRVRYSWSKKNYFERKREIQLMPGGGKFYSYFGSDSVWFEREEDAVFFTLKWE